ncbi:MAG TPA: sulfite exporter TauE/SafE family protein [Frankiaceae bacterium]|nr:sulfite exporter TauE/SafE family protein [Frankiaceae bacterium]
MGPLGALAAVGAGFAAGTINTVVGSGSLITYPVLVALGYTPLVANVSNTIGLAPGSVSGAIGYRRELVGQRSRILHLCAYGGAGGLTGGALLLLAPKAFEAIVPGLILVAALLMAFQPRLARWLRARQDAKTAHPDAAPPVPHRRGILPVLVFFTGVYGGYFGAAQGVILLALLGLFLDDTLQRLNGLKNLITAVVNGLAAVLFAIASSPAWGAAGILALSSIIGAQFGAAMARRIPEKVLRAVIVVGGLTIGIVLAVRQA